MRAPPFDNLSTLARRDERVAASAPRVLALTIVSHPTVRRVGDRCLLLEGARGREVELTRNAPDFVPPGRVLGEPLADPFLSRKPLRLARGGAGGVHILPAEGGTQVVVGGSARGPWEVSAEEISHGVVLELAHRIVLLMHWTSDRSGDAPPPGESLGMVGASDGILRVRAQVEQVADLEVPVLVLGETGTGKELVARAIHERSPRATRPFVSVNLGAIPRELAAAELFGAHKGAYTGATRDRAGYFAAARGGSLFLDEVGEAPPELQVALLRVLETGEMYPVGGGAPVATDVRLIAATDADLAERIQSGSFKAPLLHRLAGYEIELPALRERREDIGVLFCYFAQRELEAIGEADRLTPRDPRAEPWLPASVAAALVQYDWPGNIRQLRNVARRLVIGSRGQARAQLDARLAAELARSASPPRAVADDGTSESGPRRRKPSDVTEEEVRAALRESAWDLQAAAERLGIPRSSMYDMVERWPGIRTAGKLSPEEIARCFNECGGDVEAMASRLEVSARALKRRVRELGLGRGV